MPDLVGTDFAGTMPGRKVAARKSGPSVGSVSDPSRHRTYTYESETERTVIMVLKSFASVIRIEEQLRIDYRLDGIEHIHILDVRTTHRGGKRIAYFVKEKESDAERFNAHAILTAISDRHGTRFADDYRFVSFEGLDPTAVRNATRISDCANDLDKDALRAVRAILADLGPEVTGAEIGRITGLGRRGTRAAFALIPMGVLVNRPGQRLTSASPLTNLLSENAANQAA